MTKEQYEAEKQAIIEKLGPPKRDFDERNEAAVQCDMLRMKYLRETRTAKKQAEAAATPQDEAVEPESLKRRLGSLNAIILSEVDLKDFRGVEKDVVREYFINRQVSAKTLAERFALSYQNVAGLLRSRPVLLLKAKYFNETLSENTQIALLKLTQHADPKVVLAAAEYLKILKAKGEDEKELNKPIEDGRAEKALRLVGDWLANDCSGDLVLRLADLS